MNSLASANRDNLIHRTEVEQYELLVIGGGITGAGIALDATTRGLKTALLEKNDFASLLFWKKTNDRDRSSIELLAISQVSERCSVVLRLLL